jgi:hypothetical protein
LSDVSFTLRISPRRTLVVMATLICLLVVASTLAIGALALFRWPEGSLGYESVKMFWLDAENNLPTLYQSLALGFAAALMIAIVRVSPQLLPADRTRWKVLAGVFVFLALDESLRFHETFGDTSSFNFGAAGLLVYVPLVVVLGIYWLPFLGRLDGRLRRLMAVAAFLYLGGAAGIESASQWHAGVAGKATPLYVVLATLEETLEMAGVAVLVYALLDHLSRLQASAYPPGRAAPDWNS